MVIAQGTSSFQPELALTNNDVHVWCASLQQPSDVVEQLSALHSADEAARAARFHFEHLRISFIVARGILRVLLAGYLNAAPDQLKFTYEPAGKPQLSDKFN